MKGRIKQFIYQHTNSTVITFYNECMCPWENGKINRHCTAGRIFKVYQSWCKDNNNGFAQNAKEFREQLEVRIAELKSQLATEKDIALNTKHFLDLVRRYAYIQELDAEIIWNCIGEFQTPT